MQPLLYTLLTLALLTAIAAGGLYCVRLGVEIGRSVYAADWACTVIKNKKGKITGMNCKIMERENAL